MTDQDPRRVPGTGPYKRANEDRMLRQVYVSLREVHTRMGALLDIVAGILFEREQRDAEQADPAVAPIAPPAPEADPHRRQTVFQAPMTRDAFIDAVQARWDEAKTEADRANVLAMLRRGFDQKLLNEEEHAATAARLQGR